MVLRMGCTTKEDDIGMYLTLEGYCTDLDSSEVSIARVLDENGLHDFTKVFSDLGGGISKSLRSSL